jgi:hypothetical protein
MPYAIVGAGLGAAWISYALIGSIAGTVIGVGVLLILIPALERHWS